MQNVVIKVLGFRVVERAGVFVVQRRVILWWWEDYSHAFANVDTAVLYMLALVGDDGLKWGGK